MTLEAYRRQLTDIINGCQFSDMASYRTAERQCKEAVDEIVEATTEYTSTNEQINAEKALTQLIGILKAEDLWETIPECISDWHHEELHNFLEAQKAKQ